MGKTRFKIGDFVKADKISFPAYHDNERRLEKQNENIVGQVTGLKRVFLGTYNPGGHYSSSWNEPPDYGPPSLTIKSSMLLWRVRTGMMNREVLIADEDINPAEGAIKVPVLKQEHHWSDEYRKLLSECAKEQERDSKGRFTK